MKIKLPSGTTGFINKYGAWQCTGSQMGRINTLPRDLSFCDWLQWTNYCKLHLVSLPLVDSGCYDSGGAYWGQGNPLWIATQSLPVPSGVTVYVRASTRKEARAKVLELVPDAKFYR